MTQDELLQVALSMAKKTTVSWAQWIKNCRNPNYDPTQAWWYKAGLALEQAKNTVPPPPPPPPSQSVFAGKGLFSTTEPQTMANRGADWVAVQADPEGNPHYTGIERKCVWMARPTQAQADACNLAGTPFIAQAENASEMDVALGLHLTVPKALVGNPSSWSSAQFNKATADGWDLILEWYWNAQPYYTQPDAHNYPRFVNVAFGIYSEGVPGTPSYVPYKPLSEYRAVWHGSFSCWKAEAMTAADWAVFRA